MWSGFRVMLRRPLRTLFIGGAGTALGLGFAFAFMALRLRIDQSGGGKIALAWLVAQAAHMAVGFGRATRVFGFAELVRADAADRQKRREFRMEPPASSPPPPPPPQEVQSSTLTALSAPADPPALSPGGRSDT
jgi:hypothetical protein